MKIDDLRGTTAAQVKKLLLVIEALRQAIEAAGPDGIPSGQTWRSMKKLSDDEVRAAFGQIAPSFESDRRAANIDAARNYVPPTIGDRIRAAKARGEYVPAEREWFYEAGGLIWEGE